MSVAEEKGYEFTEDQRSLMLTAANRLISVAKAELELFTRTLEGDEVFQLRLNDANLGIDRDILTLQSIQATGGPPVFAIFDFEGQQVGPRPVYASFLEALSHAESFAAALIEFCKTERSATTGRPASAKQNHAGSAAKAAPSSSNTGMLSPREVELVHAFATAIGHCARGRGFAKFMESRIGVLSIALGIIGPDDMPILLGTIVAVSNDRGGYECSVKGVAGQPIPGPDLYSDITSALVGVQPYYAHMATALGQPTSLFGRIRKGLGF